MNGSGTGFGRHRFAKHFIVSSLFVMEKFKESDAYKALNDARPRKLRGQNEPLTPDAADPMGNNKWDAASHVDWKMIWDDIEPSMKNLQPMTHDCPCEVWPLGLQ